MPGLGLAVAFADLLGDLFGHDVNGGVEVSLAVLGKQVRSAHTQPDGAGKGALGGARVVVFERDAGVNGAFVKVVQLFDLGDDVILDGFRQRHAVRNENQFHAGMMRPDAAKSQ